jgi:hypothetical protein
MERLTTRQSATVLDVVARTLTHEPTVPTRQRKVLRANAVAPWELRIGDHGRSYARMPWHPGSFASGTCAYTTK